MITVSGRLIGMVVLVGCSVFSTWKVDAWRYGQQLAEQARLHGETLNELTLAATTQQRAEQDKRLALAQRLAASDQTHYEALTNAQKDQARLRDRLATSNLRLSVILDAADSAGGCAVPATTGASSVVHGGARARLDPAHAQRIVAITDEGDRGMIALAACQAYVGGITLSSARGQVLANVAPFKMVGCYPAPRLLGFGGASGHSSAHRVTVMSLNCSPMVSTRRQAPFFE